MKSWDINKNSNYLIPNLIYFYLHSVHLDRKKKWAILSILWISITIPLSRLWNTYVLGFIFYFQNMGDLVFVSSFKAFLCYYAYKMLVLKGFRFEKSTVMNQEKTISLKFVCTTSSILYSWNWIAVWWNDFSPKWWNFLRKCSNVSTQVSKSTEFHFK